MTAYTLFWNAQQQPAGGVRVTVDAPASWTAEIDAMGSPRFAVPDLRGPGPSVVLITAPGTDDAERLAWAIAQQYPDDQLAAATRFDHPDGRVSIVHRRASGHVHARTFVPASDTGSVVMFAALLLPGQDDRLAELTAVSDSVRVVPGS